MNIISEDEFNYLKGAQHLWNDYNGNIPPEDRDRVGFIINEYNDRIMPKLFFKRNRDVLSVDKYGSIMMERINKYKQSLNYSPSKMNHFIVDAEPRNEQLPAFDLYHKITSQGDSFNGIIMANPGIGKAQPLSEPILLPDNTWTTMGKLQEGDYVVSRLGKPTKVLKTFDQGLKDIYKIVFEDGTYTRCELEHLWGVYDSCDNYKVITLNEIINTADTYRVPLYYKLATKDKNTKNIVDIIKLDYQEETRCILVDNEEHLYVTRDYTVTHNTFISIKLAAMHQQKTLCIVPNDLLEKQWIDSIVNFSNLEKEDIGIIQGSDINKLIKDKVFEKDIVICKIQSLLSQLKRLDIYWLHQFYSMFGLVFYDECHNSGSADSYSSTAGMFYTDNIIGLTATPFTKGVNNFLMLNSMGDILIKLEHHNLIPNVILDNVYIELTPNEENKLRWAKDDYIKFLAMHNQILETKYNYLQYVADWAIYRYQTGQKVAVLFATNKLVHTVANMIKQKGFDCGIIIGRTKKKLDIPAEFLDDTNYKLYIDYYLEVFKKRKKVKEIKKTKKNNHLGYHINKTFLNDINTINQYFKDNEINKEIVITVTEVDNRTEREIMNDKDIIISNFKLLTAGYSKDSLGSVFIGTPVISANSTNQILGRVTRKDDSKPQDVYGHFMFSSVYNTYFPNMCHIAVKNIQKIYPSAHIEYKNYQF